LIDALLQLKHLKLGEFNFVCCSLIDDKAMQSFKKTLKEQSKISEIHCNFEWNKNEVANVEDEDEEEEPDGAMIDEAHENLEEEIHENDMEEEDNEDQDNDDN